MTALMATTTWRLISSSAADGASNMALDRALLDVMDARLLAGESAVAVLRLYSWTAPTVSTGRHQRFEAACDDGACRDAGIDLVQRPTGGRAVLHDDELTHAVIAPCVGRFQGPGVNRGAAAIALALSDGLSRLGARVEVVQGAPADSPRAVRLACFATASRAEVVSSGRKLCGSAQLRSRAALLQHGSLPITFDAARQARFLGSDAAFLASRATSLVEELGRRPPDGEIREALVRGFETALDVRLEASELDDAERRHAAQLEAAWRADPRRWSPAPTQASARRL
jgi:lipoate-protein ligase A